MPARAIVPISDVVDANEQLVRSGSAWSLHLHDACGGQSLELRAEEGKDRDAAGGLAAARSLVCEFFAARSHPVDVQPGGLFLTPRKR